MKGLPESRSSDRVESTTHVKITLAAATGDIASMFVDQVFVVAVQCSWESARLANSRKEWGRANRTWNI